MDSNDNDFADDLNSLAVGVKAEVGDMLQVLRGRKTVTQKVVALKDTSAAAVEVAKPTSSEQAVQEQESKRRKRAAAERTVPTAPLLETPASCRSSRGSR